MVPGYQGEGDWPCSLVTSLWNRVNFKAPVTHTWEQLPMGVYIPWEEAYAYIPPTPSCWKIQLSDLGKSHSLCASVASSAQHANNVP